MNGLLHRVAARAAGTAATVRSDAGLPYAGGGAGPIDLVEAAAQGPAVVTPRARMPAAAAADDQIDQAPRPVVLAGVADAVCAPSIRVPAQPDTSAVRDTPAPAPAPAPNPGITQRAASARAAHFDPPQPTMPPLQAALQPTIQPLQVAAHSAHPRSAALEASSPAPARTALGVTDPAPLMPPAAGPAPLAQLAQSSARQAALAQSGATTPGADNTEVHIHIGRIDVTASTEAPAAARRPRAVPAPLSLDGYLAQRGRS